MEIDDFLNEFLSPRPYVAAHTSGSTGIPKEIKLSKADMRRSARASNRFFGIDSRSHLACGLSPDYIAAKMMLVRSLEAHCGLSWLPVSNRLDLSAVSSAIDLLAVVPSQIPSLLSLPAGCRLPRQILVGGAPPEQALLDALVGRGVKVWVSYGMTETCSHVALADGADGLRIFKAMPGISFGLDNRGCLVVHAPEFSFGTVVTNDLAELLSPGSFRWLGRYDNIINSGGLKLCPEQLEEAYARVLPAATVFYVSSRPSPQWGREVTMVVEGDEAFANDCLARLRDSGIDHRHLPKAVVPVVSIPRTSSGKIKRS